MDFEVTELDRRLSNLIRLGRIEQADYAAGKVRVKVGENVTTWLPWLTQRAGGDVTWHAPEVGEQVVILAPSGELNQGVVLAAVFQSAYPQPVNNKDKHHVKYQDGAVVEYDRAAHHLKAVLPAGATVELVADGGISITGDITLTGTLTASVDVVAGPSNISLINHKTSLVQPGSGTSGVPVP